MKVRMLDLAAQHEALEPELSRRVREMMHSGKFILGPAVASFERAAAGYLGVQHAIGASSGSDALVLALLALELGPGDEVLTTPFSFFATVESILRVGATPRFVDVERETLALDLAALEAAITPRTRAILAVHLYGYPGDLARLRELANRHRVTLIEDTAQAFGARFASRAAGTFGDLGCFSFQPSKPLGAMGDAGLVVTNDEELAARCRQLVVHGATRKHHHVHVSGNYRLDTLQAVILEQKLASFPRYLAERAERARVYDAGLAGLPGLECPHAIENSEPSYALYTVRVLEAKRDALVRHLSSVGIETAVHYPEPLHRQPALLTRGLGAEVGTLPVAERAAKEVLSLPLYPELPFDQLRSVVEAVREFCRSA
ncbi:MAG TPA: DegT/DnrJ/EryC1/StrS family aminotransferase [Polyangiaceae bacterium]|nr:DegT/DnrJ/EryC1/StrS family aminotransferase [Polyangiaceae bacterium]